MLSDIQRSFGLREDELYAILAQHWNYNIGTNEEPVKYKDFVEKDPLLGKLDVCFEPHKALEICFNEARQYKEPTEEEFLKAQENITDPHLSEADSENEYEQDKDVPIIQEPDLKIRNVGSINLWKENQLVSDENITIQPPKDEFLRRSSRVVDLTKDAALKHYIKYLACPDLVIFHMKYSSDGYIPLFVYKTLSKYLGGYVLHPNATKVSLLEKECAINVFGYGHAMQGSLAGSYLAYTRYALAKGIKHYRDLSPSGKRFLLRHDDLKQVEYKEGTSSLDQEDVEDIEDII
ncbi:hypothetical protein GOP47_0024948 [Adiantum capillus-veneris]|uniref:Uncharacterized protein n=1 Tax=Adiantum capillus-veneris TaxID=13818 RepID=A0A9D4U3X5_ADICA|nr:hypothetical protein GOP47_0024948 [Adiantum capillus-veneris]